MKSLSPYLIKFSGLKEGIHLFNYELGNKFFRNFDYYDFLDAKLFAKLELEKQSTLLNLKFSFNGEIEVQCDVCLLYTSPSPRDATLSRMPSSA